MKYKGIFIDDGLITSLLNNVFYHNQDPQMPLEERWTTTELFANMLLRHVPGLTQETVMEAAQAVLEREAEKRFTVIYDAEERVWRPREPSRQFNGKRWPLRVLKESVMKTADADGDTTKERVAEYLARASGLPGAVHADRRAAAFALQTHAIYDYDRRVWRIRSR